MIRNGYQVTIGIPMYNAGIYLYETMDSALGQSFQDIEYLIVDDCGTDDSYKYICSLQETHPRGKDIRVVRHTENQGVAAARNTILKESTGDYLFFLDSDDSISADCIEILYLAAKAHQAEVVYSSHSVTPDNTPIKLHKIHPGKVFTKPDELAMYANQNKSHTLNIFVWNVLYNLSFLRTNHLSFMPVKFLEDHLFSYSVYPLVTRAVLLPNVTYNYLQRDGSLSQYNTQDCIGQEVIRQHIQVCEYLTQITLKHRGKKYFTNMITKSVMKSFDTAAVAVEKQKITHPPLPKVKIRKLLEHPLPFSEILHLKRYKTLNIIVYLLGKLPTWLSMGGLRAYRWLLNKYRNSLIAIL